MDVPKDIHVQGNKAAGSGAFRLLCDGIGLFVFFNSNIAGDGYGD